MADDNEKSETPATKEKRTVPAMVRTARGVADHAAAVHEMQWDKERKSFKDPITVALALFAYAKLTAALLDEAEKRFDARSTAAEKRFDARSTAAEIRTEKLEQQIAAFESWRVDIEKQSAEMAKGFEEMMGDVTPADLQKMIADRNHRVDVSAPPTVLEMAPTNGDTSVVPIKSEKADKKPKAPVEKNGGAA